MMHVLLAFFWLCAGFGIWDDAGDAFVYGNLIVSWIILAIIRIESKIDKDSIKNRD